MKYLIIVAIAFLSLTSVAQTVQQERSAHHAIKAFIAERYPAAKSRMILGEYRSYRVEFKVEGHKYTSLFSAKGDWIQTTKKIKMADVEDSVKQGFQITKYKSCKVCSTAEILFPQKPGKVYMLEVRFEMPDVDHDEDHMYSTVIREYHKLYYTTSGALVKDELEPDDSLPYIPWGND
jgi:hypothetical protein